uniref:TIM-barrel domain-containing protein n=1 Tax=Alistipes sp. TaxID=1872444 RepID=UPI004056A2DA
MALVFALPLYAEQGPIVLRNKRISIISPTLMRLEYADGGKFVDEQTYFAQNRPTNTPYTITREADDWVVITAPKFTIRVQDDNLPFAQCNTQIIFQHKGKEVKIHGTSRPGRNLKGAISTLDRVSGPVARQNGLLTRSGYYVYEDTNTDLIVNGKLQRRDTQNHLQDLYYFIYSTDFAAAFRDLGTVSGHVPMTRKYIHGVWYCRWWDYTAKEFLEVLDGYKEHNFPIDNIVFDMAWHSTDATRGMGASRRSYWTGYTWNKELIPDPKGLIDEIHRRGVTVSINDHPHDGIRPHEAAYPEFMKAMGADTTNNNILLFDPSNEKYMENFFRYAHHPSEDMGVDFWWLDWQQNRIFKYVRGTSTTILQWINRLWYKDSERKGLRGAGYSRWAGLGDHRHPIQFSGDAYANWKVLAFEVDLTSTSGNQGCYYWAHDIGGFYGGTDPELYARWTQFGAVSAALRIHSTRKAELDRRPWLWGKEAEESMRRSYHFRSQLMPYVYSSVRTTHETMLPLNRAMYINYPEVAEAYKQPQQFLFGEILLAAPITSPKSEETGLASQKVWFPKNKNEKANEAVWYDFFTHERHEGGQTKTISKDLNSFPLYVKAGCPLPMQPYTDRPATAPLTTLILRTYPSAVGGSGEFTLYEDDGISLDYEKGAYAKTKLQYNRTEIKGKKASVITIAAAQGRYKGQVMQRNYRLELPVITPKSAVCNGKKLKPVWDKKLNCWVVTTPTFSIEKEVKVTVFEK